MEIQSRTNLNGGELERISRNGEEDNKNPIQDQPKWWRAGKEAKGKRRMIKIKSRTNLNGGELEGIRGN